MSTRREFLQFAAVLAACAAGREGSAEPDGRPVAADERVLGSAPRATVTLLHLTDLHAQLTPAWLRPPTPAFDAASGTAPPWAGTGPRSGLGYALGGRDYLSLAREHGRLGGLDRIATLVAAVRAERGDDRVLLLDGGDTWQGSYTALQTRGQDMLECMSLLRPHAMTGHWEFTLGKARVLEMLKAQRYPMLAANVVDSDWQEPVFEAMRLFEAGGVRVAVIGQAMPYTGIAHPAWQFPGWSFGLHVDRLRANVIEAGKRGADVVVLLSHAGLEVDLKLASEVSGIDIVLSGHTHDATPVPLRVGSTTLLASGAHGRFLGRVDIDVRNGRVADVRARLIPVLAEQIASEPVMRARIAGFRAPHADALSRVVAHSDTLLYRNDTFGGSWDAVIAAGLREELDTRLSLSPGFRWGSSVLPGESVTVEDLYAQTAISYPQTWRREMSGAQLKHTLEAIADNRFNPDPYLRQGGDMVRTGGLSWTCRPRAVAGKRIAELRLSSSGEPIRPTKLYTVAGWASVSQPSGGPSIQTVLERWLARNDDVPRHGDDAVRLDLAS